MKAKCLETRLLSNGLKYRRYRAVDGREYKTVEMPIEVWSGINLQGRGQDRAAAWLRARKRDALRVKARSLRSEGWKTIAIAHELGLAVRTAERWVRK